LPLAEGSDAINPTEITVLDGDTIRARGRTIRLVGFDAPEAGSRAQRRRERELGDRATAQLKVLIAGGGLALRLMPCPCPAGTEGTPECNHGHACGQLGSYGRDIGALMIQYVLARPYTCGTTSCPPRPSWC
jgi:endonuclease YncB( thermonuclease family)